MGREFRVSGPPGTGKTTYLQDQIRKAISSGYDPHEIAVVSFTKAAAEEVAGRRVPIPRDNIGTIHAMCYRALKSPVIAEADDALVEQWNATHHASWNIGGGGNPLYGMLDLNKQAEGEKLISDYALQRSLMRSGSMSINLDAFSREWEKFKESTGSMDFTDLLIHAPKELPGIKVLFVDEAQDLSPLQWKIVRQWGQSTDMLVYCGDDDQTLYEFAGARTEPFLVDLDSANCTVLGVSHRLPSAIHRYSQEWIRQLGDRRLAKEFAPKREGGEIRRLDVPFSKPDKILDDVEHVLRDGKSAMILATCGYMLHGIVKELRRRGIPFHNPLRPSWAEWNPLGKGKSVAKVLAFHAIHEDLKYDRGGGASNPELWRMLDCLDRKCYVHGMKGSIDEIGLGRKETDIAEVGLYFSHYGLQGILTGLSSWFTENCTNRDRPAMEYPIEILARRGPTVLAATPQVIVGTVHSVKGGQCDHTWLSPDISPRISKDHMEIKHAADSTIRCLYVGMTRSRETVTLCGQGSGAAMRWL